MYLEIWFNKTMYNSVLVYYFVKKTFIVTNDSVFVLTLDQDTIHK